MVRKKAFAALLMLAWGFSGAGFPAAAGEGGEAELSLSGAIAIALRDHPAIAAARAGAEAAEEGLTRERAGFFPRLDAEGSFRRTTHPPEVFASKLNQERFAAADFDIDRLNRPSAISDFGGSLRASWTLYDGGRRRHAWKEAGLGRRAADFALERTRQAVIAEVTAAYAGWLLAREQVAVVEAALAAAHAHARLAENRHAAGISVKSDLLRARVRAADLEQQRLDAASRIETARAALAAAMGLRREMPALPADSLPELAAVWLRRRAEPLEDWLVRARTHRADLEEMALLEEMARERVERSRAGHLPRLDLVGDVAVHSENFEGSGEHYAFGALVQLPLFSGFAVSASVGEAHARLRQVQAERRRIEDRVLLEVRRAHNAAESAARRIGVAAAAVSEAEEALRITAERYAAGLVTMVDLLSAEAALQDARRLLFQARHDLVLGRVELERASGVLGAAEIEGERGAKPSGAEVR